MTARPFSVLVTGQLRTPELLDRSLASWNEMRGRGLVERIVMVTWSSEAEREPELCASLRESGVELVVRADPLVRGVGNVWPQMLAMDVGLDEFGDDTPVFKTRTDLWLDPASLASIACTPEYLDLDVPPGAARVFRRRVWVPWFELTTPFYLSDECFFGLAADLRVLINYDESYVLRYPAACGVTHYRRFVHPFRAVSERFEPFLERFTDTGLGRADRWTRVRALLDDDDYLRVLASSYAVYGSHFRFHSPDGVIEFRDWSAGAPQPSDGPLDHSFRAERAGLEIGHLFCNGDRWLHRLLAGELPRDQLGERFAAHLADARVDGLAWTCPSADLPAELPVG